MSLPPAGETLSYARRDRPVLVYDGDCGFCQRSVGWLRRMVGERVCYEPSQQVAAEFPQIASERLAHAVQLVEADGRVSEAAEAIFRVLATVWWWRWLLWLYRVVPGFALSSEAVYRFIARHRGSLPGSSGACSVTGPPSLVATRWVFLRLLGLVYLIAFASMGSQVVGLVGRNGILPAERYLAAAGDYFGAERYASVPSIFWCNCSDATLTGVCRAGMAISILLILDVAPAWSLATLFVLYLSLTHVGQVFLHFQWDILLLETGFLAIWVAPLSLRPRGRSAAPPSRLAMWALRLLTFKLMWCSGVVKLTSGDTAWRDLTAMSYHYLTQPIPNPLSWFVYQQPLWLSKGSVVVMFAIELVVPFLIFFGRRARIVAFVGLVLLQVMIGATGNYGFFNLLSFALCVTLLDDNALPRLISKRFAPASPVGWCWPRLIAWPVLLGIMATSIIPIIECFDRSAPLPEWAERWYARASGAFHIVGGYGLFRVMTTTRPEIVVEGSDDGVTWKPYGFRYKPGELNRAPPLIGFHMPRLDWQMWFAALGDYRSRHDQWFVLFCRRLLAGSPEVLGLLADNPFPVAPPRYVRAMRYVYRFTAPDERTATGDWWTRRPIGLYCPILSRPAGVN